MKKSTLLVSVSCLLALACADPGPQQESLASADGKQVLRACSDFIQRQADGSVRFVVRFDKPQAYVEVFARRNGQQNIAQNITASQMLTDDGGYSYSYVAPAHEYRLGDVLSARFYSYEAGRPGLFTPGPIDANWSPDFVYDEDTTCETAPPVDPGGGMVQELANGAVRFTATYDGPQAYVEVFAKQNGLQNVAANISGSATVNADGTVTYSFTAPAAQYAPGDEIVARFYSYAAGKPGVFTPGPTPQEWSSALIYGQGQDDDEPNFDSDPQNCGSPANSCLGGACVAGLCQAATLVAPGQLGCSNAFTASNDVVFVADKAQVRRFDAHSGAALPTFVATPYYASLTVVEALTFVDGALFYRHFTTFDNAARMYRLPDAETGDEYEFLTGIDFQGPGYESFGANESSVFFGPHQGLLYAYDRATGALNQLPLFVGVVRKIRATEKQIFWSESAGGSYFANVDGSAQSVWFSGPVSHMETHDGALYFTSPSGGIHKVGSDGASVDLGLRGTLIGVDESGIYYNTDSGVGRAGLDGGAAALISNVPLDGQNFAVTDDSLLAFKPCSGTFAGQVLRLAK